MLNMLSSCKNTLIDPLCHNSLWVVVQHRTDYYMLAGMGTDPR